ncbi:MAG: carboxypeptidase M32 [Chloroflexi bacterium]|nr:MAG: carboxypeptidase M32 [Chloroflexota bacterium]
MGRFVLAPALEVIAQPLDHPERVRNLQVRIEAAIQDAIIDRVGVARAGSVARPVWEKARHDENFGLFAPYLEKNVELNRRIADAIGYEDRPYDALLDRSEPGMTTAQLEAIFAELKKAIVPLIADIARHADAIDDRVLYRGFDPDLQVSYALGVVKRLGYDLERGRQDKSTHPFSTAFGPGDVRITTRVSRDFFNECLFGSIHESDGPRNRSHLRSGGLARRSFPGTVRRGRSSHRGAPFPTRAGPRIQRAPPRPRDRAEACAPGRNRGG